MVQGTKSICNYNAGSHMGEPLVTLDTNHNLTTPMAYQPLASLQVLGQIKKLNHQISYTNGDDYVDFPLSKNHVKRNHTLLSSQVLTIEGT
jgi:hypothetical protein